MIGCTVYYLEKMFTTPHLDSHSTTDPKPEIQSAVLTRNRISCDGKKVCGIAHVNMLTKEDFLGKDNHIPACRSELIRKLEGGGGQ